MISEQAHTPESAFLTGYFSENGRILLLCPVLKFFDPPLRMYICRSHRDTLTNILVN